MTICIPRHPDSLSGRPRAKAIEHEDCRAGAAESTPANRFSRIQESIVSSLNSFTTVLAGLCVGMSVVTFCIRLVQHVAALLG